MLPRPRMSAGLLQASACLALLTGCMADPSKNIGFNEPDPQARIRAAQAAANRRDFAAVNDLILMLKSDDPAERFFAGAALEQITGQTLGFHHYDPAPDRAAAIDRWIAWSKAHAAQSPESAQ